MDKLTLYEIYIIIHTLTKEVGRLEGKKATYSDEEDYLMVSFVDNDINLINNILNKFKEEE